MFSLMDATKPNYHNLILLSSLCSTRYLCSRRCPNSMWEWFRNRMLRTIFVMPMLWTDGLWKTRATAHDLPTSTWYQPSEQRSRILGCLPPAMGWKFSWLQVKNARTLSKDRSFKHRQCRVWRGRLLPLFVGVWRVCRILGNDSWHIVDASRIFPRGRTHKVGDAVIVHYNIRVAASLAIRYL